MSCNLETIEGVKSAADCKCYGAVIRAYGGMCAAQVPETVARDVAFRVYCHHHPEDARDVARLTVESWLSSKH